MYHLVPVGLDAADVVRRALRERAHQLVDLRAELRARRDGPLARRLLVLGLGEERRDEAAAAVLGELLVAALHRMRRCGDDAALGHAALDQHRGAVA